MRRTFFLAIAAVIFAAAAFGFQNRGTQGGRGQQPAPNADPYANNAAPGTTQFPLAAPAGKDSGAIDRPLPNGVNQGRIDEKTWKDGHAFDAPPNSKIWNPVKLKMMRGEKVTGGTVFASSDPSTYCAMANAGYDFIWTEMQHDSRDWENVAKMWQACPHAKAVPGVRWLMQMNARSSMRWMRE